MSVIERIERGELAICEDISSTVYSEWRMASQEINDKLLALAKQGEKMRWIPVSERLPEDGQTVLVYTGYEIMIRRYESLGRVFREGTHGGIGPVTHWMPLPEPPKEETP